jgi:uncharacterized protein YaiI (UPF0178 family)
MPTVFVDADACPVKEEVYKVARRHGLKVAVVANAPLRVPVNPEVELVVRPGFGAADDWIAAQASAGDVVVTADIPLAARCVAIGALVLDPKGRALTPDNVTDALAARDLGEHLRASGVPTGGPAPMTPRDRSRFLSKLDELAVAARKRVGTRPPIPGGGSVVDPRQAGP